LFAHGLEIASSSLRQTGARELGAMEVLEMRSLLTEEQLLVRLLESNA